jgi:hypothetical protein
MESQEFGFCVQNSGLKFTDGSVLWWREGGASDRKEDTEGKTLKDASDPRPFLLSLSASVKKTALLPHALLPPCCSVSFSPTVTGTSDHKLSPFKLGAKSFLSGSVTSMFLDST